MKKLGENLAEFGKKKRSTDYDFPPALYMGAKYQ